MKISRTKKREIEDTSTYLPHVVFYRKVDVDKPDEIEITEGDEEVTKK